MVGPGPGVSVAQPVHDCRVPGEPTVLILLVL